MPRKRHPPWSVVNSFVESIVEKLKVGGANVQKLPHIPEPLDIYVDVPR